MRDSPQVRAKHSGCYGEIIHVANHYFPTASGFNRPGEKETVVKMWIYERGLLGETA